MFCRTTWNNGSVYILFCDIHISCALLGIIILSVFYLLCSAYHQRTKHLRTKLEHQNHSSTLLITRIIWLAKKILLNILKIALEKHCWSQYRKNYNNDEKIFITFSLINS
ncbi:hypothetical protein DERF_005143 [Dermatophagoides farinae]|uniref:Uncharacterized protein n=1 Tax=Dermatophagoides farinae TaxID=6954 RepID=A0A922I690_DERFA|nr:hypothetical protein DERF_005143 [Dermatophagoides farinae]